MHSYLNTPYIHFVIFSNHISLKLWRGSFCAFSKKTPVLLLYQLQFGLCCELIDNVLLNLFTTSIQLYLDDQ